MSRKRLATFGERGALVRLFEEHRAGRKRLIVQWGPKGARQQTSYPATKAGKAEAEAFIKAFVAEAERREAPVRLTVRALWTAYLAAEAEHLRPNTLRLYRDAWRTWEQFINPETVADDITIQQITEFRRTLDARGLATATVKDCIRNVRIVFNWGERMELLARNRWHFFVHKVAKEKRTKPRAEYRDDEFLAIWRALDPAKPGQWRAWGLVGLLGIYGNRQNELLNCQWSWITADAITVDAAFVKTGEERVLALFPQTRRILEVLRRAAIAEGYTGPYVFPPGQRDTQRQAPRANASQRAHYSIQSFTDTLHRAERRAGLTPVKWRAGHGFRRGLMGDLADETGDVAFALQAIGDRDLRMAQHYRVRRDDRVSREVEKRARRLLNPEEGANGATQVQPSPENSAAPSGDGDEAARATNAVPTTCEVPE